MKKPWDFAQSALGAVIVVVVILVAIPAFRALGTSATSAAPTVPATTSLTTGYPAPPTALPVEAQGYPAIIATATQDLNPTPTYDLGIPVPVLTLPPLADVLESFDPKTYGLPDNIAGYPILAVITSENEACTPPGEKMLVVQTPGDDLEFMQDPNFANIDDAMAALGLNPLEWSIGTAGPDATRESIIAGVQEWNRLMQTNGCISTGGPILLTPEPAP